MLLFDAYCVQKYLLEPLWTGRGYCDPYPWLQAPNVHLLGFWTVCGVI